MVGAYAEQDASVTLRLWELLSREMDKEEVRSIFDLETELTRLLIDMRWRGVRVDLGFRSRCRAQRPHRVRVVESVRPGRYAQGRVSRLKGQPERARCALLPCPRLMARGSTRLSSPPM